jgi:hypothetical protein
LEGIPKLNCIFVPYFFISSLFFAFELCVEIFLFRFIYVVGGYWNVDGITALSSCIRAEILNPKEIPFVTATILLIDSGTSQFTAGYWLYAVSAIFGLNGE